MSSINRIVDATNEITYHIKGKPTSFFLNRAAKNGLKDCWEGHIVHFDYNNDSAIAKTLRDAADKVYRKLKPFSYKFTARRKITCGVGSILGIMGILDILDPENGHNVIPRKDEAFEIYHNFFGNETAAGIATTIDGVCSTICIAIPGILIGAFYYDVKSTNLDKVKNEKEIERKKLLTQEFIAKI